MVAPLLADSGETDCGWAEAAAEETEIVLEDCGEEDDGLLVGEPVARNRFPDPVIYSDIRTNAIYYYDYYD